MTTMFHNSRKHWITIYSLNSVPSPSSPPEDDLKPFENGWPEPSNTKLSYSKQMTSSKEEESDTQRKEVLLLTENQWTSIGLIQGEENAIIVKDSGIWLETAPLPNVTIGEEEDKGIIKEEEDKDRKGR